MKVDFADLIAESMPLQAKAVAAKRVGFDHLCARLQIFVVNGANQFRLRQVQFVITTVDKDPFRVQQGAHCAVTQDGRLLQSGQKITRHISENTGAKRDLHRPATVTRTRKSVQVL